MVDHYATLGVRRDASRRELVDAYRRLVRRHHPDAGGDPARFLEIQAAWEALRAEPRPADGARRQPAPTPAVHRVTPARSALADPSAGPCVLALASAAAGTALAAASASAGALPFACACAAALVLARFASRLARRQADRVRRHRQLWDYGFVLPEHELRERAARVQRLAAVALWCARGTPAAVLVLAGALAYAATT